MRNGKSVQKEDFEKFISGYPKPLKKHTITFIELPVVTWNDFTLGEFPEFSIVASAKLNEDGTLFDFTIKE